MRAALEADAPEIAAAEARGRGEVAKSALNFARSYAAQNPRWGRFGEPPTQDPNGVHTWLDRYDPARLASLQAEKNGA